jgi:D-serine deaminase-like pyridoxal phosphate-dependent protein
MQETQTLNDLATPCLVLDVAKVERNIARLRAHLVPMGVTLRPHLKTGKSVEVARMVMDTPEGPATVSTLKEAHLFAAAGVRDMIYAVGITPDKLNAVLALRAEGVDLAVLLDSRTGRFRRAAQPGRGRDHPHPDRDRLRWPPFRRAAR